MGKLGRFFKEQIDKSSSQLYNLVVETPSQKLTGQENYRTEQKKEPILHCVYVESNPLITFFVLILQRMNQCGFDK